MLRVLIIDDEPLARQIVKEYLEKYTEIEVICECGDGFDGVKKITELKPDLIFLDIQMPKINGFEMLELLDEIPAVIFTTAFEEFALKAFDTNAIDYLLKPFSEERFAKAIQKWQLTIKNDSGNNQKISELIENTPITSSQSNRIVIKLNGKIKIIPVTELNYIEASSDFVKIYTKEGMFLKSKTMNYFENCLDSTKFVRVHRSYILNIEQVTRLEQYEKDNYIAILKDNNKVPISKTGYQKLKEVMGI
jgi:two-component system, LytTR family, response regulator